MLKFYSDWSIYTARAELIDKKKIVSTLVQTVFSATLMDRLNTFWLIDMKRFKNKLKSKKKHVNVGQKSPWLKRSMRDPWWFGTWLFCVVYAKQLVLNDRICGLKIYGIWLSGIFLLTIVFFNYCLKYRHIKANIKCWDCSNIRQVFGGLKLVYKALIK